MPTMPDRHPLLTSTPAHPRTYGAVRVLMVKAKRIATHAKYPLLQTAALGLVALLVAQPRHLSARDRTRNVG